jgi:hypothetical protein
MKNLQIIGLLVFLSGFTFAQNTSGFELKLHSGYLGVHRPSITHLPQENVFMGEASYFIDLKNDKTWSSAYSGARIGVSAFFSQTGNTQILGHLFGGFAYGDLPFFRNEKHSFSARVGSGLGVASKVYDPVKNPKNNAISSHVNVIVQMSLTYRRYLKKSEIGVGLGMNHFSNGANKLPNLGLNYPMLTVSYGSFKIFAKNKVKERYETTWGTNWRFGGNIILSVKEVFPTGGKKFPVYAVNGIARKIFSPKLGLEFAVDGIYKTAILDYLPEYEKRPIDIFQLGLFAGHVLTFDRFSTILGMGAYVVDRYLPEDRFYHRIGMRYAFKNNLQVGITLKSNWGKADYVEWSVGYLFNRKK